MDEALRSLETALRLLDVGVSPRVFLALVGLAFARFVAFLQIVPFFGGAAVPGRVKAATALAFIIIAYPSLAAELNSPGAAAAFGPLSFIALLLKETLLGFVLGFLASLIFEAVQTAGRLIDYQRGVTMSELFAPQLQLQVSELGQFKLQFAIVLFLLMGAHRLFIGALIDSFALIPATSFPPLVSGWSPLATYFVTFTGRMLTISVQLAVPGVVALLLTDLFFGLINRVAPQINVFFVSFPVKAFLGLLIVLLALWQYQEQYLEYFAATWQAFEYLLRTVSKAP